MREAGGFIDGCYRQGYRAAFRLARLWWRVWPSKGEGAAVILEARGRILVLQESYRDGLGLPAGGIARGETPREAALRELEEEVGIRLEAGHLEELARLDYRHDHRDVRNIVFAAELEAAVAPRVDRREIVWADWCQPEALHGRPLHPALAWYLERRAPRPGPQARETAGP